MTVLNILYIIYMCIITGNKCKFFVSFYFISIILPYTEIILIQLGVRRWRLRPNVGDYSYLGPPLSPQLILLFFFFSLFPFLLFFCPLYKVWEPCIKDERLTVSVRSSLLTFLSFTIWHLSCFVLFINSFLPFSPQSFIIVLYELNLPGGFSPPSLTISLYVKYTVIDLKGAFRMIKLIHKFPCTFITFFLWKIVLIDGLLTLFMI